MKAVILAAGYGNRMKPLTYDTHKTLLKIGDTPIINRIIDSLIQCEIKDLVIVTGYLHEKLMAHINETYPDLTIEYVHNEIYASTNNIYSMSLMLENVDITSDMLLIESDLVFKPELLESIINNPNKNVALVDHYRQGMDGTVVTVQDGRISSVIPTHMQGTDFEYSDKFKTLNIYKFSAEFVNSSFKKILTYYARTIDDNCYYELMLGILIYMQKEAIYAEIVNNDIWAEVDDPNDLCTADFIFHKSSQRKFLEYSFGGFWNTGITDFCFIRNMYFPTASLISDIRNGITKLIHNYGSRQDILNKKLSYYLLCDVERIQLLNGAAQVYPVLKRFLEGKKALMANPGFGEYSRVFPECATYKDHVGIDTSEVIEKTKDSDVVVFVNPNNPTGSVVSTQFIYDLAADNPDKFFVIDESFIEFSKQPSIMGLLEENMLTNCLIIKSLSKSLGIPGIRLGYIYSGNKEFMQFMSDETPIWNINSLAEYYIEMLLKYRPAIAKSIENTNRDRDAFIEGLRETGVFSDVYDSEANFILAKLNKGLVASDIIDELLEKYSIFAKDISSKFDDDSDYLRLAVRLPQENEHFIECIKSIIR
jgi:histidinol-phosphate/aromatic aminotransferase/cobyric acid decarboxylase-like protein/GTP:adenosylcobinamide-phosphate guanylyltransferase